MGLLKILFAPIRFILKLLLPKKKTPKPDAVKDLENPTADAGRPIPVVFGTITVRGLNVLHYSDKASKKEKITD